MRRRRQRLQPSTFPFVAVLLCAMGGLILLLLVLDRRAKIVAQARAREAWQQAVEQRSRRRIQQADELARLLAARQAEWERQKEQLHQTLVAHEQQLRGQIQQVQRDFSTATARVAREKAQQAELLRQIAAVEGEMQRLRSELAQNQQYKGQQGMVQDRARAELLRLQEELAQLQQMLRDLQALRQRQQQTFSLIPYAGRRGEKRKPIYIECTEAGLVFHPDRLELREPNLSPQRVREELERRLAASGDRETLKDRLYLFVLVRPEGLQLYYLMQTAVVGLPIDLGYEFIDSDWVLELTPDAQAAPPPWQTADVARPYSPVLAPEGSGGTGVQSRQGVQFENPGNRPGMGNWPSGPLAGNPAKPGTGPGVYPAGESAIKLGPPVPLELALGGSSPSPSPGSGGWKPGQKSELPDFRDQQGKWPGQLQPGATSYPGQDPFAALKPNWHPSSFPPKGTREGKSDAGTNSSPDRSQLATALPQGPNSGTAGSASSSASAGQENSPGVGGGNTAVGPLQSESVRRPAPILSRLLGNRDWYIDLDCRENGVTLRMLEREFAVDSLTTGREGGPALVQAVTQLIARKQATVRPGEPPYRPILRFDVTPDGLRAYYAAHRHLEALRLPMLRTNVEGGSAAVTEDR